MNCLEFRRAVLSDPRRLGEEAEGHAGQCAVCREFRVRELELEDRLVEALRVPLPDGLADRMPGRTAKARHPVRWLALAASLLAAAGFGYLAGTLRPDPLAVAGIDFVVFEEAQSIVDAKPIEWKALVRVAGEMGVSLPEPLAASKRSSCRPAGAASSSSATRCRASAGRKRFSGTVRTAVE